MPENTIDGNPFWDEMVRRSGFDPDAFSHEIDALHGMYTHILVGTGAGNLGAHIFSRFAPAFSSDTFARVKVGDELHAVTNQLGVPLDFTIIPEDANAVSNNPLTRTDATELAPSALDGRDMVLLRYSQPKWCDYYEAYEIFIRGGKVIGKRAYWYWD